MDNYQKAIWGKKTLTIPREEPESVEGLYNKYGYRSEDFKENTDILAVGCSTTHGMGLLDGNRWQDILGETLSKTVNTISVPGAGTTWLIDRIFEYFNDYGHPKMLLCVFPDFNRIDIPVDREVVFGLDISTNKNGSGGMVGVLETHDENYYKYFMHTYIPSREDERPKYLKLPAPPEHLTSVDIVEHLTVRSIRHLEAYCKAANIPFLWTLWQDRTRQDLENLDTDLSFNNYFDLHNHNFANHRKHGIDLFFPSKVERATCQTSHFPEDKCGCHIDCHSDIRENYGPYFDCASDTERGVEYAHLGVHAHIHIFEAFMKELAIRF